MTRSGPRAGSPAASRWRARLAASATLVGAAACSTYAPAPLPNPEALAGRDRVGLERLTLEGAALEHPLLAPLEVDLSDGLSPDEAAVLAVLGNPTLVAVRDARSEAAAQLVGAGLLPDPTLSGALAHPHGDGAEGLLDATTLGLEVDVSALVGRAARVAEASAGLEAVDLSVAWQEWQVAQAARLATTRLAMLERRLDALDSAALFEAETVRLVETAVTRGDATVAELAAQRSALQALHRLEGDLDRQRELADARLHLLLGLAPETTIMVAPPALGPMVNPDLAAAPSLLAQALRSRLDLRAFELGYQAQEARVRRAVLAQFPALSIGVDRERDETGLRFLGGFVTLRLPFFDRHRATIAIERTTRVRLRHEYEARVVRVRSELARLLEEDRRLARRTVSVRQGVAALVTVDARAKAGVADGDLSRLVWQETRARLLDARLELAALVQARLETRVAIDATVGARVAAAAQTEPPDASPARGGSGVRR